MESISGNKSAYTGIKRADTSPTPQQSPGARLPEETFEHGAVPEEAGKDLREWTILAYLNGNDKFMERDALYALLYMEESSAPEHFNLVAQLGRAPQSIAHPDSSPDFYDKVDGDWEGVRRYSVRDGKNDSWMGRSIWTSMGKHDGTIDSALLQDLGRLDMSNPEVLKDFLQWGIKNFPAKHYAVILAGHGNGFLGTLPDYQSRTRDMPLPALADVFKDTIEKTGVKPDVLVMDACLMAHGEAAYQMKDSADLLVASENINYDCLAYQDFLGTMKERHEKGESVSPKLFAQDLISACAAHEDQIPTISALDLSQMAGMKDALAKLAQALIATDTLLPVIRRTIEKAHQFVPEERHTKPLSDYRDMVSFAKILVQERDIKDQEVKNAARALLDLLESKLVIGEHHKSSSVGSQDIHGITMYLPADGFPAENDYGRVITTWSAREVQPAYLSLSLVQETGWDKVIQKFAGPPKPLPPSSQWF